MGMCRRFARKLVRSARLACLGPETMTALILRFQVPGFTRGPVGHNGASTLLAYFRVKAIDLIS